MIKEIFQNDREEVREINGAEIPMGETFTGQIAGYRDWLFLRMYGGIVSLNNPGSIWTFGVPDHAPRVRDYTPVDITIDVLKKGSQT